MNVLLIGSGGREHAIAWKLRQSPRLTDLHVAPGNAGTADAGHNIALRVPGTGAAPADVEAYLDAAVKTARDLKVDLVFVAPDDPLSWGLVDRLEAAGIAAFGASGPAAQIESSKTWAKAFMKRHAIPNPGTAAFDNVADARNYIREAAGQLVVKADGLAAGKGAIVTSSTDEALEALEALMTQRIAGEAGSRVVIEDRISGPEVSAHAFCDGRIASPMPLSCDHKTVLENNEGPMTGGMGVYSPPWWAPEGLADAIMQQVTLPAVDGMRAEGQPFRGVLYPQLMLTDAGLQVIEFNARFGDPETQALLPRLQTDLLDVIWAAVNGKLGDLDVKWSDEASVCVVMASGGYPGPYASDLPITGIEDVDADVTVFHAGTRRNAAGELVTAGGRVLGITATGPTLADARAKAYANVERIRFEGAHYRRDIGLEAR
jgi:phosphoribosylamine--glycine ligase